jgi:hypothetical protein
MEPMIIGAVAGAATNRDDPFKGALMGAALGGMGGGLLGNAAGAAGGAAEGAVGASELGALARKDVAPVLSDWITQAEAAGDVPMTGKPFEPIVRSMSGDFAGAGSGASGSSMYGGADLSWMDRISPSQQAAIETGKLPGSFQMPSLGGAMSALSQSQPRTQMPSPGGIRRGQPQAVNYGGLASLLEPKLVERRRLSLL